MRSLIKTFSRCLLKVPFDALVGDVFEPDEQRPCKAYESHHQFDVCVRVVLGLLDDPLPREVHAAIGIVPGCHYLDGATQVVVLVHGSSVA